MDYNKPTLLVISGQNGAGKSTHIQTMLTQAFNNLISCDQDNTRVGFEIELSAQGISEAEIMPRATRMMEERFREEMIRAINSRSHFVLETPLFHPDYWKYIDMFEHAGYQVHIPAKVVLRHFW